MPEVDDFIQLKDNQNIVSIIAKSYGILIEKYKPNEGQLLMSPTHYAYLKIADGCNNNCAYCTIPRIRVYFSTI